MLKPLRGIGLTGRLERLRTLDLAGRLEVPLRGQDMIERMKELAEAANQHHRECEQNWGGMLEHAQQAGEALIEAKRRLGHRTKWTKWRNKNFVGSREKAISYMRVARHWNDPRMQQARRDGFKIDSIRSFHQFLRGDAFGDPPAMPTEAEWNLTNWRDELRRQFAAKLRTFQYAEVKVLVEIFRPCLLPKLYAQLKHTVSAVGCDDFYKVDYEREQEEKIAVRARVNRALNRDPREYPETILSKHGANHE